jgi:RNA polymerase sigma-70 factor (ECF subfamily)
VERCLRELKPRERALLWLAHVEGADHREIAAVLGVAEPSVRVLLFRARRRLAAVLEKRGLEDRR